MFTILSIRKVPHLTCFSFIFKVLSLSLVTVSIALAEPKQVENAGDTSDIVIKAITDIEKSAHKKIEAINNNPIADIPEPPNIDARSFILIDADNGFVIHEKDSDKRFSPASLTKLMTSYIVSGKIDDNTLRLSERVTITRNASGSHLNGSSRMWLKPGSTVTIDDLHRGLVVSSANDAAISLAEYISKDVDSFSLEMNKVATRLGMKNTQFKNPHGLTQKGHYSTAQDMSILAQAVITDYPKDYFLYKEKHFSYNGVTQSNRNTLLWSNAYVDGLKTGYTKDAGYCLIASAKKDGMRLISVVMGTASEKERARQSEKLLAYGFRHYERKLVYSAHSVVKLGRIWKGEKKLLKIGALKNAYLTLPKVSAHFTNAELMLDKGIMAPIEKGEEVGEIVVTLKGKVLLKQPVYALESIAKAGFFKGLIDHIIYLVKGH
jgi:serine-type D-Ala-D-Ala carboxypeptidase (penicillin-binding protein 5/6)